MPAEAPPAAADPHAGHQAPAQNPSTSDPDAGHSMTRGNASLPPVAPPPAEALSGPAHAADTVFDPAAMARSRAALSEEHGGMETSKFLIDQLEVGFRDGRETYTWDAQFWYGGDINKLWLKTEGEGEFGDEFEGVEVQALWSRAIDPWFDLQLGVRQDLRPGPDRTHLVAGVQGLAPYWFELEAAVFLSNRGEITARAEVEYDLRLTQNLILQPRGEVDFSLQDVTELGLGSGLTTAEIGARLRYEFFPRSGPAVVAPYVGVQYERAFGGTADFRRTAGEEVGGWSMLLGVRTWF
jgi:copper resistance protein B